MKPYLTIALIVLLQYGFSQNDPIELVEKMEGDNVILVAKNTSEYDVQMHLKLSLENATSNIQSPVERIIKAGEEQVIGEINVIDIYEKWNYNPSLAYERYVPAINLEANNDTIILFTMTGCGRCDFALDYLNNKKYPYVEYNTTRNFEHTMMMWNTLKAANHEVRDIRMPVLIVNNEVAYNIKSLPTFMEALKDPNKEPQPFTTAP